MTMPVEVLRKVEEGIRLEAEAAEPGEDHSGVRAEANSLREQAHRLYARIKRLLGTHEDVDEQSADGSEQFPEER